MLEDEVDFDEILESDELWDWWCESANMSNEI